MISLAFSLHFNLTSGLWAGSLDLFSPLPKALLSAFNLALLIGFLRAGGRTWRGLQGVTLATRLDNSPAIRTPFCRPRYYLLQFKDVITMFCETLGS